MKKRKTFIISTGNAHMQYTLNDDGYMNTFRLLFKFGDSLMPINTLTSDNIDNFIKLMKHIEYDRNWGNRYNLETGERI